MIELPKDERTEAIASIQRWFDEHLEQRIGNLQAGALLSFMLEEVGPLVYNRAVADVQERLRARIDEIDIEVHADPFQYWRKYDATPPRRR